MIACPDCGKEHPLHPPFSGCDACGYTLTIKDGFPSWSPELSDSNEDFDASAHEYLAEAARDNFWFVARNALITWALQKYAPPFASYLEVGCGTGYVLEGVKNAFPDATYTGSEIYTSGLKYAAKQLPGVNFVQLDARRIPYRKAFDVIAAFDVIEHIEEDEEVLDNLRLALADSGALLLSVPQHPWLWSKVDELAHHKRRYTIRELHDKLSAAGFRVVFSTSFVCLLLPAMLLSRLASSKGNEFSPADEFDIPGWLNQALKATLAFERGMIKLGLRLPLGGSRLVVAYKASA
jgi:SAM-dependent methyltransferase